MYLVSCQNTFDNCISLLEPVINLYIKPIPIANNTKTAIFLKI